MKRGTIGRATRVFGRWYNKNKIDSEEVAKAKQKRVDEKVLRKDLAAQHWDGEKIRLKRERAITIRNAKNAEFI